MTWRTYDYNDGRIKEFPVSFNITSEEFTVKVQIEI